MEKATRQRIFFILIAAGALLLVFDPFSSGRGSRSGAGRAKQLAMYSEVVEQHRKPGDLLVSLFTDADIVLVGEQQRLSNQLYFIKDLIPSLYQAGVRILGLEYALVSDQDKIDVLLAASEYDAHAVHRILFNYLVIWGYQEYADIFKAVWSFNKGLSDDMEPFRIIALNVERNWSAIQTQKDMDDPEKKQAVLAYGFPDEVMARTIVEASAYGEHKALVLCAFASSFSQFQYQGYVAQARRDRLPSDKRLGNFLYQEPGVEVRTVFMHGPWQDDRSRYLLDYPFHGAIDRLLEALPEEYHFFGVDLRESVFADLPVSGSYARGHAGLRLAEMADAYIVLGPLSEYRAVQSIPGFINEHNLEEAIQRFPGPDPGLVTAAGLNEFMDRIARQYDTVLEDLR